jgi:hypothetical protein
MWLKTSAANRFSSSRNFNRSSVRFGRLKNVSMRKCPKYKDYPAYGQLLLEFVNGFEAFAVLSFLAFAW